MTSETACPRLRSLSESRCRTAVIEIAAIFALIFLYGCWPVPDVNEPYYVGKAIHFWNPDGFAGDPFLNAPDSHWLFFASFGFFSLFLTPTALVWFGRILIWGLTAWSWRSLSVTLIPKRGYSILTAAACLCYLSNFHLAGEWIAGGVEGKGFAFPFLFWGLAALLRRRYGWAFVLMGIASAFHVLVGGWGVLASLLAISLAEGTERIARRRKGQKEFPTLSGESAVVSDIPKRTGLFLGLALGGLISLVGLIPALALDAGTSAEIRHQAHVIYVYERLAHHLVPSSLPWIFPVRFLLLAAIWSLFCRFSPKRFRSTSDVASECETDSASDAAFDSVWRRWNFFVAVSLGIAGVGFCLDYGVRWGVKAGLLTDPTVAADGLRFYWFRLSDWVIPAGVAFGSAAFLNARLDLGRTESSEGGALRLPLGLIAAWGFFGFLLFVAVKRIFLAFSTSLAVGATENSLFPALPRPVDGVAFLTTALALGFIAVMFRCVSSARLRKSPDSDRHSFIGSVSSVGYVNSFGSVGLLCLFLTLPLFAPAFDVIRTTEMKTGRLVPRSNPPKASISDGWLDVCRWARENSPESAVFLVPRGYESWKWNARRGEVGNWKEIPQDAASIVPWFAKMEDLYTLGHKKGKDRWNQPLIAILLSKGKTRILKQAERYGFDYVVAEQPPYNLASFPEAKRRFDEMVAQNAVYQNGHFLVFRLSPALEKSSDGGKMKNETSK